MKFNFYFFLFYPPTLNIICLVEKKIFLTFCLCIFESDTVKNDCPVQIFRKMLKYLKITLLVLLFSGDIKEKKALKKNKKSSENDQSTGHFQSFFILFFSFPRPLI